MHLTSYICGATVITSDSLDYLAEEGIYIASGNVKIQKDDVSIRADRVVFNEISSDVEAVGNVIFEDKDVTIATKKAEINIESKTGSIYDAVIFFRKDNYWVTGTNISKTGVNSYYASEATFTTCNSEPILTPATFPKDYFEYSADIISEKPDWCFKGQNVYIDLGKNLTAKNVTYRIKSTAVLYSPYILIPILSERQTGFLMPVVGTSSKKGFQFSPAFFWAIDDDKDATFYLDYLSRRGFGKGIEFRYLDHTGIGTWQAYHLKDTELKKDFFGFKAEDRFQYNNITGFADINYINDPEFYKEYGYNSQGRISNLSGLSEINRFFQSSAEFSLLSSNSRLYFLSQYWVDLQNRDEEILQRLPELGYVMNPFRLGPMLFSISSSLSNFYREKEVKGQRLFINPVFSYSFGDSIRLFQSLSLRQAAYNLTSTKGFDSTLHRETFEYRINALTRLYKYYSGFVHDIELSLGYRFIPKTNQSPLFDYNELFNKTSQLELAIFNSIRAKDLSASILLTQPYDLKAKGNSNSFLPIILEATVNSSPFILKFETAYDLNKTSLEKLNSIISIRISDTTNIYAGERYDKANEIKFFSIGADKVLSQWVTIGANLSYDAKGGGLRDTMIKALYKQQCWAVNAVFSRKPGDLNRAAEYNFSLIFELTGLGKFRTL